MKKLVILVLFLISLNLVNAENSNITNGLNWLNSNIDWNGPIEDISFTLLAFDTYNINTDAGLIHLNEKKDPNGCFPLGNCNTKDTALATLSLHELNQNISAQLLWLNSSLTSADVEGSWIIQIVTSNSGNCTLSYDNTNSTFNINGVQNSWIYVNNQQSPNINIDFNQPVEYVDVDCNLGGSTIVSLLRSVGNSYYIIKQLNGNNVVLEINNACYPSTLNGDCNVESSFYVSWALNKLNIDVKTIPYLENNANTNLFRAMLADITENQEYINNLVQTQNVNWDNSVYTTSFAVDALEGVSSKAANRTTALNWLTAQQQGSGSWNNDVTDTAVALYLALNTGSISPGNSGNTSMGTGYCGDGLVETTLGEQCDDGGSAAAPANSSCKNSCVMFGSNKCKCPSSSGCNANPDCNPNQYCDNITKTCKLKATSISCDSDLDCDDNEICNTETEECESISEECTRDRDCRSNEECNIETGECEPKSSTGEGECIVDDDCDTGQECLDGSCIGIEKKSSLWWLWAVIIVIALAALGLLGSKYLGKGKGDKEDKGRPPYMPSHSSERNYYERPVMPPRQEPSRKDDALERELDKSLREARDILKKK
ncbi:MAG: hypothetical protein V1663_05465 [archaeon]